MKTQGRQAGFSMIEVLVAAVLLSIGLLGLASLQTVSLQRGNSASQRVDAVALAYDLLDRMRANRAQAIGGRYVVSVGSIPSANTLADQDVIDWKGALNNTLPEGDGAVAMDGRIVTITIVWKEASSANSDNSNDALVNLRTQL
ncbi:MAG TPA: type IV pilus modification protein PilV [Solimonas sp.]|nr:type IV pilus modification protein PilV [Solimonas sp.]